MKVKLKKCGSELNLSFGTDAEFFLEDESGAIVPASKVIPGAKHNPHVLDNGVCHPDGLSLEVGCPPSDTPEGMLANLFAVLQEVNEKFLVPSKVSIAKSAQVNIRDVKDASKEDLEFGCGVEFDCRSPSMLKASNRDTKQQLRFSGFHIHIGYTEGQESNYYTFKDASRLVLVLDHLVKKHSLETSGKRAEQYGGLGAFRVKPYGIEYRCMDCSVITNQAKYQRLLDMLCEIPSAMEGVL